MAIDPNVLDETKKQKATEPDSLASYIDSYRQRGGLALGNPFQQQETTRQEEPGFFQNVAGDVAGGIIDYGEMMGRAGRAIPGGDSAGVDEGGISSKVIGWAEQFKKDNPWADRKDREGLSRWFHEGLRSAVTSLAAGVPGAAVGAAAGTTFGPVGTFLGGLAGYALSGATTFGMAEYDSFLQEADAKGISREESEPMAILSACAEGGFEFLGDLLQGATLGGTSVVTAPGKAALKTTVKEMLKLNAKQALKRAPIGMGFETGSELLTAGVQTEAQRKIGLTDQKFFDGATQAFGPSLVASAIFQAVGFGGVALNQRAARNTLANADADPKQRLGMVQAVDKAIREQNPELADRWNRTATEAVLKKEALDLDTEIGELPSGQPSETPPPGPRPTRLSALNQIEEEIFQLQSSERDPATGRPAPKNADHYAQLDDLERRKQTLLESLTPEESADHTMSVVNKEVNQLRSELGLPVHSAMAEDESVSSAPGATRSKTLLPDEMQTTQSRPQAPYGTISEYEGVGTQTVEKVAGQAPQTAQSRLTEVEQKIANLNSVPETARSPKMQENLQRLEEEKTNLERVLFEQPGSVSPAGQQTPNILYAEEEGIGGVRQTPASTNPQEISNKLADKKVSADLPSAGTVTAPQSEASDDPYRRSNYLERVAEKTTDPKKLAAILEQAKGLPNEQRIAIAVAHNKATDNATFELATNNEEVAKVVTSEYFDNIRQRRKNVEGKSTADEGEIVKGSLAAEKQPWEMGRDEFIGDTGGKFQDTLRRASYWSHDAKRRKEAESIAKEHDRKSSNHLVSVRQAISEGKPVPAAVLQEYAGEEWADKALSQKGAKEVAQQSPVNYSDPRLKRKEFRDIIGGYTDSITTAGKNPTSFIDLGAEGTQVIRHGSVHPPLIQKAIATAGSVKDLRNAVRKAANGGKLGTRQAEAVKLVLDQMQEEVNSVREGEVRNVRGKQTELRSRRDAFQETAQPAIGEELEATRKSGENARAEQIADDFYVPPAEESNEYPAEWDAETKTLADLYAEARKYDKETADALLERQAEDFEIATQLWEIIQDGRKGEGSSQVVQGEGFSLKGEAQKRQAREEEQLGLSGIKAAKPEFGKRPDLDKNRENVERLPLADEIAEKEADAAQQDLFGVADQNPASVTDKEGSVAPVSDKIKPDAPISRATHDVSVDDTIYLQDDYENKRHPVNFRGWVDNDTAMVIYNGWQMSFDRERLFKNDLASNDVASASDKEVATKTTKAKDGEQAKGTERKIEDFGEEIGGARKMLYAEAYGDKLKEAKDVDVSAVPLSKSWPEPDYAKLLEGGMDSWSVSFIRSLRDQIPTKPQKRWKLSGWAKAVNDLRALSEKVLSGEFTRSAIEENLKKSESLFNDLMGKTELYEAVGHEQSLKDFRVKAGQYTLYEGVKYDTPKTIWTVEKPAKATAFSNWPQTLAKGETREEVIAAFKKNFANIKNDKTDKQVSFAIYQKRGEDGAFIGKKIGKDYIDLEKFDTITEARKYLKENNDKLTEKLGKFKEVPNERKESNSPRVGEDHRNDADITPEIFSETFGFRGVQFGNYVEGKKRQEDLNQAYDALMDLAGVLGVEPKALSLNGELGLAFGARGTGGRLAGGAAAAAHYESGRVVINLTKNRGAGSLAHEWWHGLDNYFSRMRGDKGNYLTRQATPSEGVRPEMVRAFMRVMNAIAETGMQKRAALLDKTLTRPYWGTKIEMSARSFESYVIAKLQDQGASNDYLANIVSPEYWDAAAALGMEKKGSYPYPSPAEIPAIRAAFDEFFREIETKKTDKGVALFSQAETTNSKLKEDVDRLKNRVETLKAKFTKQEVESEVKRLTSKWKNAPKITVIESVDELPGDIKDQALSMPDGDKIEGVYIPGPNEIFIISSNMPNTKRIEEIIVHEAIGHHGIESIVDQKEFFNILLQLSLVRPEELNKVAEGYGFSLTNKEERLSAAKEVLARMAERGESNGFVRRTIALIKDALRRLGFKLEYTDTDFKALIAKGRKFVEKGVTVSGKKAGLAQFAAAWHGTPHKFDKFSMEFVGAGEGNQAYGWGLYFASAKEVAEHYRDTLARELRYQGRKVDRESSRDTRASAAWAVHLARGDKELAKRAGLASPEKIDAIDPKKLKAISSLYQVELAPKEDEYLLWDKPLSEQSEKVKAALSDSMGVGIIGKESGQILYHHLSGKMSLGSDKAASEHLHSLGIRGIKYLDGTSRGKGEGDFNYVIFDDNDVEIKAQFSRPTADIISEKFDTPQAHSWTSAIKGAFDTSKWTKDQAKKYLDDARTKVLDRLHPVEQLGQKAYRLHRMLGNTHAVLATFLQHGKLQWKQGALSVATKDKGFLPWLHALGDDGQKLFYWMAAKRAEVLDREGRENWLDKDARNRIYDEAVFNDLTPAQRREKEQRFETLNKEFQEFNQNIIRIAKESGLISDEQIDSWTKDYYLPFYRLLENEATHDEFLQGPRKAKQHISAQIKRLKGGEEKLGNPVENVLRNWSHLIQESQRNVARSEAATVSVDMGIGRIVPKSEMVNILGSTKTTRWGVQRDGTTRVERYFDDKDIADGFANMRSQETGKAYSVQERVDTNVRFGTPKDHQIISYQKNGETTYLRVEDPDLFEALAEVNAKAFDSKALKLMSGAKRLLTAGATFTPAFRVANLLRDSLHTAVVAKSFTPFIDSAKGVLKVWKQNPDYIELMASGGGFGQGWIDSGDPRAMARSIEKIIKSEGKESRWRILDSPRRMLEFWERVGHASEMAARVQLYTNLKEKGVTHMDAAFEARDLLDFHRTGSSNAVRVLAAITPFLNARFQGLDRLYRGAKNDPKGFMVKGALVAAASLALWAAFEDDDRYKELEDWEKWQYHHFWIGDQHFRIPKAFEVGALFSSMFESSADVLAGNEEAGYFIDFLKHTLTETFAVGMPAAFGPSIEIYANKSAFTGRAIEGMAISRLPAGERANPWTSEMLKDFGKLTGVSPIKAEHILRGHTAAFGAMFLATGDFLWRNVKDTPPSPAPRIDDVPLLGRFVRSPEGRTKYATRYYDFARELSETVAAINNYKALGDVKAAQRLAAENKNTLQYKRFVNLTNRQLAGLRKQEKAIWASENLGSSEKRDKLNSINRKQNEIYKNVYEKIYNDNR